MKTIIHLLTLLFVFATSLSGQTVKFEKSFFSDTTISIREMFPEPLTGLMADAHVVFHSQSSLVRAVVTDSKGKTLLLFESYPLISENDGLQTFTRYADETMLLPGNTLLTELNIYVRDAECRFTGFEALDLPLNPENSGQEIINHKLRIETRKVMAMNNNLKRKSMLWRAGLTDFSLMGHSERVEYYSGDNAYNSQGLEYYSYGVFDPYSDFDIADEPTILSTTDAFPVVKTKNFDWRRAHGANLAGSPYFDGNPDVHIEDWTHATLREEGNGWMTKITNQRRNLEIRNLGYGPGETNCPNGCYAYAPVAAIEAFINLYFNRHLDYDLSEQHFIDYLYVNYPYIDCYHGGWFYKDDLEGYSFTDEATFPWLDEMTWEHHDVSEALSVISGVSAQDIPATVNATKYAIMKYGPVYGFMSPTHVTAISGFMTMAGGDTIHTNQGWGYGLIDSVTLERYFIQDTLVIDPLNPSHVSGYIGKTAWIYKQSGGTGRGLNGYVIINSGYRSPSGRQTIAFMSDSLVDERRPDLRPIWRDEDGDGYYFWGLGPKPEGCPGPDQPDCDDNDPRIQYYDENMVCRHDCDELTRWSRSETLYITTDTRLTGDFITAPIVVRSGAVLTLTGDFFCTGNAVITAEPNARIVLDGATFSPTCCDYWPGFRLLSDFSANTNQRGYGRIFAKDSFINNAACAIDAPADANIYVRNVEFTDNRCDINMGGASYGEPSPDGPGDNLTAQNCRFITTVDAGPNGFTENIRLYDVKRSLIMDCDFMGKWNNPEYTDYRVFYFTQGDRSGIYAFNSALTVNKGCQFRNLHYAVKSQNSFNKSIDISSNTFHNCYRNIYLSGSNNAKILSNNIHYWERQDLTNSTFISEEPPYGIYIDGCTNFRIEENKIGANSQDVNSIYSHSSYIVGIVVKDSYLSERDIYLNKINCNVAAVEAINKNRNGNYPDRGLRVTCNEFRQNYSDIFVTHTGILPVDPSLGIAMYQGSMAEPASNQFTVRNDWYRDEFINIYNNTWNIDYFHNDPESHPRVYPEHVSENVSRISTDRNYNGESCPSKIPSGRVIIYEELNYDLVTANNLLIEHRSNMDKIIDNGNTSGLLSGISLAGKNLDDMNNELYLISPYLSNEVLKEVARNPYFAVNTLVEIMILNSHSAKDPEIMGLLESRGDLPESDMRKIKEGIHRVSEKELLEAECSALYSRFEFAFSELFRFYMDDEKYGQNEIEELFSAYPLFTGLERLVLYYIGEGNFSGASKVMIDKIGVDNDYPEINALKDYCDIIMDIKEKGGIYNLSYDMEKELVNLKYGDGIASVYADNILSVNKLSDYREPVLIPSAQRNKKQYEIPADVTISLLEVYPNPTYDIINISYNLIEKEEDYYIKIVNSQGITVLSQIIDNNSNIFTVGTEKLSAGTYIIYLESKGKILESKTISVINK